MVTVFRCNQSRNYQLLALAIFIVVNFVILSTNASAAEITGITEANKKIGLATVEPGLITHLKVKIGDRVRMGDLLVSLDSELQETQVDLASKLASFTGEMNRTKAEVKIRSQILEHLQRLQSDGFAQNKELLRAEMELKVAQADLLSRQEKQIEELTKLKLAKIQLQRRSIRATVDAIVADVLYEQGEYVSQLKPEVVTLIQVNPIIARFQVPVSDINRFQRDLVVKVTMEDGQVHQATVHSIGVFAESETVTVKVKIPNDDEMIRCGQQCHLRLPSLNRLSQK